MKIKLKELKEIVVEELQKETELRLNEDLFSALKGGASELGRKVKNAAGDIKQAGQGASLRADLNKTIQSSGQQVQMFQKKFQDLADRARNLGLENEEQMAKQEIQALGDYMRNASSISSTNLSSSTPKQSTGGSQSQAGTPPSEMPISNDDLDSGTEDNEELPSPNPISPEQAAMLGSGEDLASDYPEPGSEENPYSLDKRSARTKPVKEPSKDKPKEKTKSAEPSAVKRAKVGKSPIPKDLTISKVRDVIAKTGNDAKKASEILGVDVNDLIKFVYKHSKDVRQGVKSGE